MLYYTTLLGWLGGYRGNLILLLVVAGRALEGG